MRKTITSKPLVSVVVPVYNVEDYIDECMRSLVNQTLGLEKLEIIVVDDKGVDGSMDIINSYINEYPETVRIIKHAQNKGLGAARNSGFSESKGEYVSFVDSDDFIDIHTFATLIQGIIETDSDIGIYAYEYYSESGKQYERNPSSQLFKLNKSIDRYEYAQYPELVHALSACNKVYKREIIEKSPRFPEDRRYEDGYFSVASYLQAKRIYITNRATYFYRKREVDNNPSIMDELGASATSFIDHVHLNTQLSSLKTDNPDLTFALDWLNMRTFYKFGHVLLLNRARKLGLNNEQQKQIYKDIKKVFLNVDPNNSYIDIGPEHRLLYETIGKQSTLGKAKTRYRRSIRYAQLKQGIIAIPRVIRRVLVKLFNPAYYKDRFRKSSELLKCYKDVRKYKSEATAVLEANSGEVWLISERGDEAKDNGYFFFKYLRENHPTLAAYFVIDENASVSDRERVNALGNVIVRGSNKHKIYFLAATKLISTHARGLIEPWKFPNTIRVLKDGYWRKKFIFMQHGVIINNLKRVLGKEGTAGNFDLFICGGKPEHEEISKKYGYDKENVVYTGLARYDTLHDVKTKNQILLMPTWRLGIVQSSWSLKMEGRTVADSKFLQSEYYKAYQSFINSPELAKKLKEKNISLVFYPHFEIQQYLKYFTAASDSNIIIANKEEYEVNKLLRESKVLITDYSSVLFDMAYMGKPTIMYQFDEPSFFANHYPRGYFNYRADGFGPVVGTEKELINMIDKVLNNDFAVENKYTKRAEKFFQLRDRSNSERIYTEIMKLQKN